MQAVINFEGNRLELLVGLPATVLQLKQLISQDFDLPVGDLNLFEFPDEPRPAPGLRLFADNNIFPASMQNKKVNFVLTLGREHSSCAYCYVRLRLTGGRTAILTITYHRFATIGLMFRIFTVTGQPSSSFRLSHNINGIPLAENWNLFRSKVANGTILYGVPP